MEDIPTVTEWKKIHDFKKTGMTPALMDDIRKNIMVMGERIFEEKKKVHPKAIGGLTNKFKNWKSFGAQFGIGTGPIGVREWFTRRGLSLDEIRPTELVRLMPEIERQIELTDGPLKDEWIKFYNTFNPRVEALPDPLKVSEPVASSVKMATPPSNIFNTMLTNPDKVDVNDLSKLSMQFPQVLFLLDDSLNKKLLKGELTQDQYRIGLEKIKEVKFSSGMADSKFKHVKPVKRNPYRAIKGNTRS